MLQDALREMIRAYRQQKKEILIPLIRSKRTPQAAICCLVLASAILAATCERHNSPIAYNPNVTYYWSQFQIQEKARPLAAVFPWPVLEKNPALIAAKTFTIGVYDVLQSISSEDSWARMGKMTAEELKAFVRDRANELAEQILLLDEANRIKLVPSGGLVGTPDYARGLMRYRSMTAAEAVTQKISDYWAKIRPDFPVSWEEMKEIHDKRVYARVRYIVQDARPGKTQEENAAIRRRIEEVRARAVAGEDFAELARKYSSFRPETGGLELEYGRVSLGPTVDKVVFGFPVGAISEIFERAGTIGFLKVEERFGDQRSIDEQVEDLKGIVQNIKFADFQRAHVEELKKKSRVRTKDPWKD